MARMTGGEALAKQLAIEGVKVIFGVPGVQLYGALAGLRDERPELAGGLEVDHQTSRAPSITPTARRSRYQRSTGCSLT